MKLLVDTQALLWFAADDPQLTTRARDAIESDESDLSVSIVSFWEIGIKLNLRKLTLLDGSFHEFIARVTVYYGMSVEPVVPAHAEVIATMPHHHKDPFDRMIAAQSLAGGFRLISSDAIFDQYGVPRLW